MTSQQQAPHDIATLFHNEVSDPLLKDMCRAICKACQQAHALCNINFRDEEAHDVLPHLRRAFGESNIRDIATRHNGVSAESQQNVAKNCYHTRIHSGSVVLTVSYVSQRGEVVREAAFRNILAWTNQLHLFKKEQIPSKDTSLYSVLLYGNDRRWPEVPSFLQIAFLHPNGQEYLSDPIDLLKRFPDIRALITPDLDMDQEEVIPDGNLRLRMRKPGGDA
jgi:actin-related protein